MWSAGVILYIMLCGYPPFNGKTDNDIYKKIEVGKFEFKHNDWKNVSSEAMDLIKRMLTYDPKKRISAQEVMSHPWVQHMKDKTHDESHKENVK